MSSPKLDRLSFQFQSHFFAKISWQTFYVSLTSEGCISSISSFREAQTNSYMLRNPGPLHTCSISHVYEHELYGILGIDLCMHTLFLSHMCWMSY